jgi:DNA polymerase-3 subunit alpha
MHLHAHSKFSCNDAIQDVGEMARLAVKWGQPGLGLTDHGNMSGTVQLYQAGKKYGIPVFPGFEGYLVEDHTDAAAKRYHFGLLSTTLDSFRALVAFSSLSHTRPRFNRFPRHDLADMAELADTAGASDLVLLTGCYFGLVQQTLVEQGPKAARRIVEMYASWFPNTVVEIQNHSITHPDGTTDEQIVGELIGIADRLGLPVVATQDSHYLNIDDKPAHEAMKRMVYRQGDANEFPGDSFHFASTGWVEQHYTPKQWARSEEGHAFVLGLNKMELPALDKYKPHVPKMSKTPQADLEKMCIRALDKLADDDKLKPKRGEGPQQTFQRYRDRMFYELGIIKQLGYADYFLHVLDFVTWCRKHWAFVEARGSANGSLVCFLIGVTQIDPLQWKYVTFERFMSPDRQKPPDIDIDIEDTRRKEAVAYIQKKYGAISIGNYAVLGSRDDDDKGSILVTYNSYLRSRMTPAQFTARFGKGVDKISDIRYINKKDYTGVRRLAKITPYRSYGVHAAGLLLSGSDMKVSDYVPTMLVPSSDTIVSQYTMDDLEALGYMKDDVLGQRTLRVMTRCQELMGQSDPMDFSWIPLDDPETCSALSQGRMDNAIFQFEGYAMAKGVRSLGIRNTEDCILAGALFRPACIDSGVTDTYLKRRNSSVLRNNLRYPHPAFERALKSTYGCVLFQEQVLEIMRGLGLDYAGINSFFKIVKDSGKGATERNVERAQEVRKQWDAICAKNGITDKEGAWHYIEGYVKYGFNAAHATGYGVRSYRCAYLKTHYPLEYMTAALESVAGKPKKTGKQHSQEDLYVRETRRMNIRILPPDVTISGARWTMDSKRNAITKGLASIKGVGEAAQAIVEAREQRPFTSVRDLAERLPAGILTGRNQYLDMVNGKTKRDGTPLGGWVGKMKALKEAGALKSLGVEAGD